MTTQIHQTDARLYLDGTRQHITLTVSYVATPHDNDKGCDIEIMSVRAPATATKGDEFDISWMLSTDTMAAIEADIRSNS